MKSLEIKIDKKAVKKSLRVVIGGFMLMSVLTIIFCNLDIDGPDKYDALIFLAVLVDLICLLEIITLVARIRGAQEIKLRITSSYIKLEAKESSWDSTISYENYKSIQIECAQKRDGIGVLKICIKLESKIVKETIRFIGNWEEVSNKITGFKCNNVSIEFKYR